MELSYFASETDNAPKKVDLTWDELSTLLAHVRETDCVHCEGSSCPHKLGPAWSPAVFDGPRAKKNVKQVNALVVDLDHMTESELLASAEKIEKYEYIAHASHSDRPGDRCLRVVIPLDRPVPGDQWQVFWPQAMASLGIPADEATSDASRIFFLPSRPKGTAFVAERNQGKTFAVGNLPARIEKSITLPGSRYEPRQGIEVTGLSSTADNAAATLLARHWPERGRHYASLALAGALAHAGWPQERAEDFITAIAATVNGDSGEPDKRSAQVSSSIAKVAAGEDVSGWPTLAKRIPAGAVGEACKWLGIDWIPDPVDISLPAPELGSDGELFAQALVDVRAALRNESKAGEVKLLFEPAINLHTKTYPPTLWLVEGLLTEGGTGLIAGEPKSIKTWIACEIALGVATGTPVCGKFPTGKPRRVAYFFAEDFDRSVRNRSRAIIAGRDLSIEEGTAMLHVQPRGRFLDLLRDEDLALVIASLRRIERDSGKVELLILEPLRDLHSGQEDKSDDMSEVMRRLRAIETVAGCTVLGCHHSAKSTGDTSKRRAGQKMRGSGAIHGSVDSGIYLGAPAGDGRCRFETDVTSEIKSARGAGRFSVTLTLEDDLAGEAVKATWDTAQGKQGSAEDEGAILEALGDAYSLMPGGKRHMTQAAVRTKVKGQQARVNIILADLFRRGLVAQHLLGKKPVGWVITEAGRRELGPLATGK
jgi:hypothetical protein